MIASGHLAQASRVDLVHSPIAVAIPSTGVTPDISSEAALKQAVLAAHTISYSTGPSGNYLAQLFERWAIAQIVKSKLVVPPPGTPVASLVASGQVALGFQQLSELLNVPDTKVLGQLPAPVAFITTFSAGLRVGLSTQAVKAAHSLLEFLNSADAAPIKLRNGMTPIE